MAAKVVLSSRRFQKDYTQFLRKYTDLEDNLRAFLKFRETARPDQSFNTKDRRLVGAKFWHCHLIHGKAILIYQLHASEIRLIMIEEHNAIEMGTGSSKMMLKYAKSLTPEDYYQFHIDAPTPRLDTSRLDTASQVDPLPPQQDEAVSTSMTTPASPPVSPSGPPDEPANPLLDDKLLHYLRGQQLLYMPRPANPVIVLHLTREIIAPKGDVLVIDTVNEEVHHLTVNELGARFTPKQSSPTTLGHAVATSLTPVMPLETQAEPLETEPDEPAGLAPEIAVSEPEPVMRRTSTQHHHVGPQLGRLIMTLSHLQRDQKGAKFDTATIGQYLSERDRRSLSAVMVNAQKAGMLKKAGKKGAGPGYVYSLTGQGERTCKAIGDWPFEVIGEHPPWAAERSKA